MSNERRRRKPTRSDAPSKKAWDDYELESLYGGGEIDRESLPPQTREEIEADKIAEFTADKLHALTRGKLRFGFCDDPEDRGIYYGYADDAYLARDDFFTVKLDSRKSEDLEVQLVTELTRIANLYTRLAWLVACQAKKPFVPDRDLPPRASQLLI